ncbi:uncharacterized protein BYT42DRAFT_585433 [Radiomyces spectabilis]|uniref:uncharacterized protein n=1 Tax=Radiomyces spectabilis TaxID=64574 RepID=UPI00221FD2B3|nr:uncharacterized protein BYT42DRAFT_585433 [Radiomyces spectabilis]KAI8368137.1 hypothetical protein BYT42DRAFT_585433 [Radiomyces spectabilis]
MTTSDERLSSRMGAAPPGTHAAPEKQPIALYHPCNPTFDRPHLNSTDPNHLHSLNNPNTYNSVVPNSVHEATCIYLPPTMSSSPPSSPSEASSCSSTQSSGICEWSQSSQQSQFSQSTLSSQNSDYTQTGVLPAHPSESTCPAYLPCNDAPRTCRDTARQERSILIEKLVDTSAEIIDSIWQPRFLVTRHKARVMSTRGFIHEILKRSKTSYSTLQISLFYLFRVKRHVHERLRQRYSQPSQCPPPQPLHVSERLDDLMCCGRRMFLASLMVASKFLHDKNYRNCAWAKISGLDIAEINASEMAFLKLIDYRLYVSKTSFDKWYALLHGYIQKNQKYTSRSPATTAPYPPRLLHAFSI